MAENQTPQEIAANIVAVFGNLPSDMQQQIMNQINPQQQPEEVDNDEDQPEQQVPPNQHAAMQLDTLQLAAAIHAIGQLAHAMNNTNNYNQGGWGRLNAKLPIYKGEPGENIMMWTLQVNSVFQAQGITAPQQQIAYAATALEDSALHWYLNQCQQNGGNVPWTAWTDLVTALKQAFQPPHYQAYLRTELRKLKQTHNVQD